MKVVRTEYQVERGKPVIYIFHREEDGTRRIETDSSFVPYFYVPFDEKDNLQGIRQDPNTHEAIDGTRLVKVYTTLPEDVPKLRDNYSKHWEADIVFQTRWLIDQVDKLEPTNPKIMFLDIETDNHGRVPNVVKADEPVISISFYCDNTYTTFVYREDLKPGSISNIYNEELHNIYKLRTEEELLNRIVEFIRDEEPDVITGWNVIRFDMSYLLNRMTNLNIDFKDMSPMKSVYQRSEEDVIIKGIAVIDLYDAYRKFNQGMEESYKLDYIANKVVGKGKTETEHNIRYLWKRNIDGLIEYNVNDVLLIKLINNKLRLLEFMDEIRRMTFCQLENTLSAIRTSDCYILRLFHNRKVFPSKEHHEKVEFEGAFVASWATGIYNNVAIFDIRSLYPNIVSSFNLSPETIVSNDEALWGDNMKIDDVYIMKDKKGFLPEVIENLFRERAKYKKIMKQETYNSDSWKVYDGRQKAIKLLLNALYGQTAYPGSRLYEPRIAKTVTWIGRKIINWSKDFIESLGYKALYADTDSLSISMGSEDLEQAKLVLELVNDSYSDFVKPFGLTKHGFEMEFQKFYRKAFFGKDTKKRYAGHMTNSDGQEVDKLDIWGFEVKRSDASPFSRNLQRGVFDLLLRKDATKDEVLRYIGDEINRLRTANFTLSEIGIPKAINKRPQEYGKLVNGEIKGIPAHVRGAIYTMQNLKHDLSNKPKMIYIAKMPNGYLPTDVLCFDDDNQIPAGTEIDIEKMLEKLIKNKLQSIFEALGWKLSDLVYWWRGKAPSEGNQLSLFEENNTK